MAVMAFSIPASALTSCRSDGGLWFALLGILFKYFQLYVSGPGEYIQRAIGCIVTKCIPVVLRSNECLVTSHAM